MTSPTRAELALLVLVLVGCDTPRPHEHELRGAARCAELGEKLHTPSTFIDFHRNNTHDACAFKTETGITFLWLDE